MRRQHYVQFDWSKIQTLNLPLHGRTEHITVWPTGLTKISGEIDPY